MVTKTISDYYEIVEEHFPELRKKEVEKIMRFGWRTLYYHILRGGDIHIYNPKGEYKLMAHFGILGYMSKFLYTYWIKKLARKLRINYRKFRHKYDGYYYFGLCEKHYDLYKEQKYKSRKYYNFDFPVKMYRSWEECQVQYQNFKYFFRFKSLYDLGPTIFKMSMKTDKAEFFCKLDNTGFKRLISYETGNS